MRTTETAAYSPEIAASNAPTPLLDHLALGNDDSERSHRLVAVSSNVEKGALDETMRRLLPGDKPDWRGGTLSFLMKVDSEKQSYLTVRCSGDEVNEDYLILFCEGKQVGYRHLGDVDVLALPDEAPRYNGRFYYVTTPLPLMLTKGKSEVRLEIQSTGPIAGYSPTFEQYQKVMSKPSLGLYRLYTHTDGCFVPPADEKQGVAPQATTRTAPGPEVLDEVKERVNKTLDPFLKSTKPLNQMQVQFLAKAYFVRWCAAYQSPAAIERVVSSVDELYSRWKKDPEQLWNDKATWNPGWFGVGPAADAVRRLSKQLEPALAERLDSQTRRVAWSAMFQASRDWLRHHRRWLTNQAMFTDVNLYLSNRAVSAIDRENALPESKARDYLYQSIGLVPWVGSDTPKGSEMPFGSSFYEVTRKGLTRERGYAGGYGEGGVEGTMDIYEATRESDGEGDPKIKAQLVKMLRARGPFRYPMLDADNHTAMLLETAVGWRDTHMPGNVIYAERGGGEHSPIEATAATLDPAVVGYAQQMFADNQFFAAVATTAEGNRFRDTTGLLEIPDQYDTLRSQPASPRGLPMSWNQPDFVFSDEEDGVVAIKNGTDILYASLYWRAGYAINFLARTHYLTPTYQQTAVVREDVQFTPSGEMYTRPDWINFGFGNGGTNIKYPPDIHQASAGEELPIAKIPPGVNIRRGDESHFAGKGDFYTLRYGRYLIGMNTTADRTFKVQVPPGKGGRDLVSKTDLAGGSTKNVGPLSTVVLYVQS